MLRRGKRDSKGVSLTSSCYGVREGAQDGKSSKERSLRGVGFKRRNEDVQVGPATGNQ